MPRGVQIALVAAGGALLVALIRAIGIDTLGDELRGFGIAFVGVVAFELLLDACNTLGWRRTLAPSSVGFWRLFWIRQAGTAVNQLTPTATLGGEVVKAMLLRPRIGRDDALASIVAAKLSFAMAQTALVLFGLAAVLTRLHGSPALRGGVLLAFAATCAGVGGFLVLQRRGLIATVTDWLWRLGLRPTWLARLRARGAGLDARLATLHRERPGAFLASVAWHFAAQLVGTFQLFCILRWLGTPANATTCLAIEAFALVIDSVLFFVPGRIGVQEGGRVLVFTTLGLSAATGLAVAVVVRVTQLSVAALGLAAFGYFSLTSAPATGSISET
jgi:uncharacterized membrane protein YbhN (UPF0104 family)